MKRSLHTFKWIIDKNTIVDPIGRDDLDENKFSPPRMVNITLFQDINNQASRAIKEQLKTAEYDMMIYFLYH